MILDLLITRLYFFFSWIVSYTMAILKIFSVQLFNIFLEATTRNKSTVLSRRGNFGHLISVFNTAPLFSCNVREMGAFFIIVAPINAFRERYIRDAAEVASAKVAVFLLTATAAWKREGWRHSCDTSDQPQSLGEEWLGVWNTLKTEITKKRAEEAFFIST